jgi:tetratricopeptide (TPR) repeat protein
MRTLRTAGFGGAILLCAWLQAACQGLPTAPIAPPETLCPELLTQAAQSIAQQHFPEAIAVAGHALHVCDDPHAARMLLARAQMLSGAFAAAESTLLPLAQKGSHDAAALVLLGQTQYLAGSDGKAQQSFTRAVAAAPGTAEPLYWLARLEYTEKRYADAIAQYAAALRAAPGDYRADDGLGLCYEAQGDMAQAQVNFTKAIALVHEAVPHYDQVYADDAALMLKLHESQTAFDLAGEGAQRNPGNAHEFYLAAEALEQKGDDARSLAWAQQAVRLDATYPEPHYLMARLYHRLGRETEAAAESMTFKRLQAEAPAVPR